MAISFVAAATGTTSSGACVVSKPAGVTAGDVLVAFVAADMNSTTAPAGWTYRLNYLTGRRAVLTRVVEASEPSSYTWTFNSTSGTVSVVAYRGVDSTSPVLTGIPHNLGTSTTVAAYSVTLPEAGRLLVCFAPRAQTPSAPTPAGLTARAQQYGALGTYVYDADAPAGASPAYQATVSNAVSWSAISLALRAGNVPPTAPTWVTPQDAAIATDADFDLDWDAHDPDPGDTQSQYVLDRWTLDSNGARVAGSYLRTTVTTPNTWHRITAGTLAAGAYEFKVATRDSQGAPTDPAQLVFSESLFVTAAASPTPPTITSPTAGATISTSAQEYTISAPDVDESEWTLYADNNGSIDTGTVLAPAVVKATGDVRRHTFTGLANNTPVWASVRIKDAGLWSQPTQQRNPVAYSPPPEPTYSLIEDQAEGEITVQINNPAPGAGEVATSYNDVFITDPGKPEQRRATEIPANGAWTYQLPPSGFDGITRGSARVEAVADNGTRTSSA